MADHGVDALAIDAFTDQYRRVESGESGIVAESTIEPLDMDRLADARVPDEVARRALSETVVIKLNGGLGTSMGLEHAKSLLAVRDGLTFLDVIAQQVLAVRSRHQVRLPLLFMNSFRTREGTLAALKRYPELASDLPADLLQNKVPKLLVEDLTPVTWVTEPALEWCPPGHGDLYTALSATGLINRMIEAGFTQVFVSNSDNLGAVADPRVAGWFAHTGSPFAVEAVPRTAGDRKGGHFARRTSDHRIVLRETAQTRPEDRPQLADVTRHRFASTNNLWFNLAAMSNELDARGQERQAARQAAGPPRGPRGRRRSGRDRRAASRPIPRAAWPRPVRGVHRSRPGEPDRRTHRLQRWSLPAGGAPARHLRSCRAAGRRDPDRDEPAAG